MTWRSTPNGKGLAWKASGLIALVGSSPISSAQCRYSLMVKRVSHKDFYVVRFHVSAQCWYGKMVSHRCSGVRGSIPRIGINAPVSQLEEELAN